MRQSWSVGTLRCGVRSAQRADATFRAPPSLTHYCLIQPPLDSLPVTAHDRFMPPQRRTKSKGAINRIPNRSKLAY